MHIPSLHLLAKEKKKVCDVIRRDSSGSQGGFYVQTQKGLLLQTLTRRRCPAVSIRQNRLVRQKKNLTDTG